MSLGIIKKTVVAESPLINKLIYNKTLMATRFRKLRLVGKGGFGKVYQALDLRTGEIVALKELYGTYTSWEQCCNQTEVKALQVLTHPNIVTLKEVVLGEDQRLMLVYELLDKDLYKMIEEYRERKARIEEDKIRILMYQLLKGVACIHKRGYFHRDLKPENLVLKEDELLKITDFGIIKETSSLAVGPFSDYIATRWYRAPEVVLRSTNYDSGIDVWAIGCIMAEMYMLYPLFPGNSELD